MFRASGGLPKAYFPKPKSPKAPKPENVDPETAFRFRSIRRQANYLDVLDKAFSVEGLGFRTISETHHAQRHLNLWGPNPKSKSPLSVSGFPRRTHHPRVLQRITRRIRDFASKVISKGVL